MYIFLGFMGLQVGEFYGNLLQMQWLEVFWCFKDEQIDIFVVIDVVVCGFDIEGVKMVINFIMFNIIKYYVYWVG